MGRFMSPDWSSNPISIPFARIDNPQTLNLYSYVGNNPLRRFDSNGHLDCSGGALQDVACAVTAAAKSVWGWLSGGSGNSSQQTSVTTQQTDDLSGPAGSNNTSMSRMNLMAGAIPNRSPDFFSASMQFGNISRSMSYMPSTRNLYYGPALAGPKGASVAFMGGWSKRPEAFLGGASASVCAYAVVGVCGGSSLTSFAPTSQAGFILDPELVGWSVNGGYSLDWNSYTQSLYESLPVENSNGAVGIGSGLSYNPCTDDFNCQ